MRRKRWRWQNFRQHSPVGRRGQPRSLYTHESEEEKWRIGLYEDTDVLCTVRISGWNAEDSFFTTATLCRCGKLRFVYSAVERCHRVMSHAGILRADISVYWSIMNLYAWLYPHAPIGRKANITFWLKILRVALTVNRKYKMENYSISFISLVSISVNLHTLYYKIVFSYFFVIIFEK